MFSVQYSVFQHIGLMHEQYQFGVMKIFPWCYADMPLVLPGLNSILPSAPLAISYKGPTI